MFRRRPPTMPTSESVHVPAPVGGLNTVDPASAMPATDAPYLWNCTSAELGLRSRLGWREHATGLGGAVPTMLAFTGSRKNGSSDRVFAVTAQGIWDVSSSTTSPTRLITFGTQTGEAGYGVSHVVSTPGGRFLVYCDEENGAFVYSESTGLWTQVVFGVTQLWTSSTLYLVGNQVVNGANVYVCTQAGTSGSTGPTGTGTAIVDGGAKWDYVSAASSGAIGPSLADQNAGFTGNPGNFVACTVWKSRLWFVERDSTRAWYMGVNSLYGTATSFDFGLKMRAGGPLANLYNWSYDGGSGLDTLLVGVSTAGDLVIYQGTDPSSANTFGLKGAWYVAGVPYGRRVATEHGGDVLVLSRVGLVALSKLVSGKTLTPDQFETYKVSNLFNLLAAQYGSLQGWQVGLHPEDNALVILVPQASGLPSLPLVMSMATHGWGRYRDIPMLSMAPYAGLLYFGTADGRVCINTGYVDGVSLANPNASAPISCSVLFAYNNLGNARQKRVHALRPSFISASPSLPVTAKVLWDYDLNEPAAPSAGPAASGTWGNARWDFDVWGGDTFAYEPFLGATGMGRAAAIAVRWLASSRTSLVGVDVLFSQGGIL